MVFLNKSKLDAEELGSIKEYKAYKDLKEIKDRTD
jgi:hypothetical protein